MQPSVLADTLFSQVQQRVLGLLFGQPDRTFYASEVIRLAQSGSGGVQRELQRLEESGLVSVTHTGNQKHYQANRRSPIFHELRGIVLKTVGVAAPLREALAPHAARINAAFVYGSVAKGEDSAKSDVDVMVIGDDVTSIDFADALHRAEKALGRPVNPNFVSPKNWKHGLAQGNSFYARISAQPKIFILGTDDDLQP
jgi:predicted nucleotidyltransferase